MNTTEHFSALNKCYRIQLNDDIGDKLVYFGTFSVQKNMLCVLLEGKRFLLRKAKNIKIWEKDKIVGYVKSR